MHLHVTVSVAVVRWHQLLNVHERGNVQQGVLHLHLWCCVAHACIMYALQVHLKVCRDPQGMSGFACATLFHACTGVSGRLSSQASKFGAPRGPRLQRLLLEHNGVGDVGMHALVDTIKQCPALQVCLHSLLQRFHSFEVRCTQEDIMPADSCCRAKAQQLCARMEVFS